ncbi:MAG: hypothetical protein Q9223_006749 [Gallowayella weberi]
MGARSWGYNLVLGICALLISLGTVLLLHRSTRSYPAIFDHGSRYLPDVPSRYPSTDQSILMEIPLITEGEPTVNDLSEPSDTFAALLQALDVMQSHYYTIWQGQWPGAIDWTAAVMGTQVSATLAAMTETWQPSSTSRHAYKLQYQKRENLINRYFTQITSFYFGENAFSLRTQAYDDMLWVVLGWLESIKFINLHSNLHHSSWDNAEESTDKASGSNCTGWYAHQFIPQFAHRARLFYDLASKGWDTSLCGGGMTWNPHLAPYKNAITNQLYISASISMYLYFPGDRNASPFSSMHSARPETVMPPAKAHDPQYLENAVEAYQWLKTSGMTNRRGLYTDGFHIRGWKGGENGSTGTGRCDLRDEKVYTYNQGVVLSGLRGLWEATGSKGYLEDGHQLIRNVIAATGWDTRGTRWQWQWSGLGRNGVMEEACDSTGTCSQDGHTFKGIFFHHFTLFCASLPKTGRSEGHFKSFAAGEHLLTWHHITCKGYGPWIRHNAQAAYMTRDAEGEFGTWWGIPGRPSYSDECDVTQRDGFELPSDEGTDYRNEGVPVDSLWRRSISDDLSTTATTTTRMTTTTTTAGENDKNRITSTDTSWDPNDRGRGRTVETQSGGLAILRALWKVVHLEP